MSGLRSIQFTEDDYPQSSGSVPTYTQLQQMLLEMQNQLQEQQNVLQQQRTQIDTQAVQLNQQRAQIEDQQAVIHQHNEENTFTDALETPTVQHQPPASVQHPSQTYLQLSPISAEKIKVNKPQEFTGKRENTSIFIAQCRLYLRSTPHATEDQKVAFVCSYLRGQAFKWYANLEETNLIPNTVDSLFAAIKDAFGESNIQEKARLELDRLRQTKSCASYTTEFNRLITEIGYTDPRAIIDMYRKGLKENVKDLMLTLTEKKTVAEYQKDAITCDIRLFQRAQEQRSSKNPSHLSKTPSPPAKNAEGPSPMEIDSVTTRPKGKVSEEEKKRRKELNLCPYDGESNCPGKNDIKLCPNLIRKNEKRSARPADRK